ncbi:MAG: hypothetical protein JSS81_23905 [Acidobacteria bacterium]|nr:hypothetical protein [Acidobacteriota bacterium]
MDSQSILFEKRAQAEINKLKETYVIDLVTAERLRDIFIYLFLSRLSRNPRGISIQTEKLNAVLHHCPRIVRPEISVPLHQRAAA